MILSLILAAAVSAATADTRGPDNVANKHFFCVQNAESGACEDCWSDSTVSSAHGTCDTLKISTNGAGVHSGKCSTPKNRAICKPH